MRHVDGLSGVGGCRGELGVWSSISSEAARRVNAPPRIPRLAGCSINASSMTSPHYKPLFHDEDTCICCCLASRLSRLSRVFFLP